MILIEETKWFVSLLNRMSLPSPLTFSLVKYQKSFNITLLINIKITNSVIPSIYIQIHVVFISSNDILSS